MAVLTSRLSPSPVLPSTLTKKVVSVRYTREVSELEKRIVVESLSTGWLRPLSTAVHMLIATV